jgi:hypothetical protein
VQEKGEFLKLTDLKLWPEDNPESITYAVPEIPPPYTPRNKHKLHE